MSNSKLAPSISPTLTDHPRANLVPWKLAINRAARGVFAEWDTFGFLFAVCDDALLALLNTPAGGAMRVRPDFPEPAALAVGANPAARDAFKRATESRAALLACSASFLLAILDSIGEANRLAISDPLTDTLHLTPRAVIVAMTALHGVMTGAEVDTLRLPLKKKLSAVSDLPSHIVTFRGVLARLANAGQATLPFDVYRLFLATLTPFPVFQQYTLLFTVANGAIAQQTFEAYAAYILPQLHNILAHSNPRPFAGNLEGFGEGASEDDVMEGDLVYPPQTYSSYPTVNTVQPYYPPTTPPPPIFYHPPLALDSHPTITPTILWPMGTNTPTPSLLLHLHPPHQTRKATNNRLRSKAKKAERRRAPLTPTSRVPPSPDLQNCISIVTSMAE